MFGWRREGEGGRELERIVEIVDHRVWATTAVVAHIAEGIVGRMGVMMRMVMVVWMMWKVRMHHGARINVEILLVLEYDSIGSVLKHLIVFAGVVDGGAGRVLAVRWFQIASVFVTLDRIQIQLGGHHCLIGILHEEVLIRSVHVERRIHSGSSLSSLETLVERRK